MDESPYFNPYEDIRETRTGLPHWQQHGRMYFITFRLGDALPQALITQLEDEKAAWLLYHPEPWTPAAEHEYHQRFTVPIERWLDNGCGECLLRVPAHRRVVADALMYFEGERTHVLAYVIMPNHVHLLVIPAPSWDLEQLLHSWKSFTAHAINRQRNAEGNVWMRDYFDRLIRDQAHFVNCVRYIRRNPIKAHLRDAEYTLWENELAQAVEW